MRTLEAPASRAGRCCGAALLLVLLAWQGWLTLSLFGDSYPWPKFTNDEPVLSGKHPQHQYLGCIGATALTTTGRPCAYVPDFQAAFPKTPIFNGSRLAEVFFYLGGENHHPAAYKVGLFVLCLFVPIFMVVAARGIGLDRGTTFLAAALGILIWWGPHCRGALEAGESDLHMAALAILAHVGMLVRFDRQPGWLVWLGMWFTAAFGWFAQPLLVPIALPLLLLYYLCAGVRHANGSWHAALFAAQAGALAIHVPWLVDWVSYWWLRLPLPNASEMLPHRTFQTIWNAPLWGGPLDRFLAMILLGGAAAGLLVLYGTRRRPTARLLGLGTSGLLALALLGIAWEPLGQVGTTAFLAPAYWFAAVLAACASSWLLTLLWSRPVGRITAVLLVGGLVGAVGWERSFFAPIAQRAVATQPLQIGLGPERQALVAKLVETTSTEARILWEDRPLPRTSPRWSALLPRLTQRAFIGGLDPDGYIEHSSISFLDQMLDGRHISTWSDRQLEDYCRRYNIGWIVAWSPAAVKRLSDWPGVRDSIPLQDDVAGCLLTLQRQDRSFALKGQATLLHADDRHVTLGDVTPDQDGIIVLSFHWQAGLRAAPSRVQVERENDGHDPIGFIRLRTDSPAARVTLTWDPR